jgi:acyl-CoA synthetase (AMP-forming)/AMP-acid ligase II
MGRQAFTRFLTGRVPAGAEPGVTWDGVSCSWEALRQRGQDRAALVRTHSAYVVDPNARLEALASLFAVASVPDTVLLWASVAALGIPSRELAPGLYAVDNPVEGPVDRPLWGVGTSGSSGRQKLAIGHADQWELIALHYDRAMYQQTLGESPAAIATCLPLQFSAAFFMAVLPSLYLRCDLLVFPPHDWTAVTASRSGGTVVLGVPALAAAACLGTAKPVDMAGVSLYLGGGHVSAERVAMIRDRFRGAAVLNLYGTAETGAVAVDPDPGHNAHVGRPIPGKTVWLEGVDDRGVGAIAVAGPDCARYVWRPGEAPVEGPGYVASTDYGRFDGDGRLCLEGRVDGGEKLKGILVYPRAIERHLLELPGVVDVRVLVHRDPSGLEHLLARVVGSVNAAAVREHCAALPEIERPARIECVAEREALAAYSAHGKL